MRSFFRFLPFLIWFNLAVSPFRAASQIPAKIEHYSTEDGLSHDVITTVFKDQEGYMWFGTWGGLNRFDGNHFRSFRSVAADSSQIANNRIDHISEDNTGHLWIKAYDSQIYRFSKKTEQFRSLAVILKITQKINFDQVLYADNDQLWVSVVNDGVIYVPDVEHDPTSFIWYKKNADSRFRIPSNSINCFLKDAGGNVWLGTTSGMVRFNNLQNRMKLHPDPQIVENIKPEIKTISETDSQIICAGTDGMLWLYRKKQKNIIPIRVSRSPLNSTLVSHDQQNLYITTAGGELVVLNLKTLSEKKYKDADGSPLYSLFEDREGSIWIEPEKKGVLRFDKSGFFENYFQRNDSKNISGGNHFKVFEDVSGFVWCVLRDGGFGYFDYKTHTFNYFHDEPGAKDRIFSNLVSVAFYDPAGVLWLHTDERGLEKVIFQPHAFGQHLVDGSAVFQSANEIRGLCVDQLNRVWICAKSGVVYWLQHGALRPANFVNLSQNKLSAVYTIKEDHEGNIWMGTKTNGLFEAIPTDRSRQAYRLINFSHDNKDPKSISSNQIYALSEDRKGQIWIGTFDSGLNLLQRDGQRISFLRINKEQFRYPDGYEKIRTIETDGKGQLWIGTTQGLVVMSQHQGAFKFRAYNKQAGVKESLGNNDILFIYRDRSNRMWLATSGGGLDRGIEDQNGEVHFVNYTTRNGLASDYILSCVQDNADHLWIATKSSLARLNLTTKDIKNFTSYDGLPKTGFSESTCQLTRDGKLIFGTIRGYLMFDPRAIKPHVISANLVFTGLRVGNQAVGIGDSTQILKESVDYTRSIILKHDQNAISLEYSLLDYRFASNLPFKYRLKGFDTEWHDNTNQFMATYTNIPAGEYVLEVRCAADPERYSNSPYKRLAITVLSAPWLSWWAYVIYGLIVLSIGIIIWRSLFTALQLRQQIAVEHQLTELKLNFFTNISHELRTPLMLILNPIAQLTKYANFDTRQKQYLEIVSRNADRMVRFVNQLLEFRKVQHGKAALSRSQFEMGRFIKDISAHFEDIRKEKRIELVITGAGKSFEVFLDQDKIETVIYNLLSNAYKFTPEDKNITISMSGDAQQKEMILTIADQGCGVPESDLKNIFELYHSSDHSSLNSAKGTGIGLALSKELVELHGGTITATNNVNGGLSVKITLPYVASDILTVPADKPEKLKEQVQEHREPASDQVRSSAPLLVLVEDNLDMREFLKMQLSEIYRVETAADGLEGLEMVRLLMPDIVLSDVMMPRMDGIELIDILKNDIHVSHIPVVLMSARTAVEHQIKGLNYGADYYLSKPFKNELLIAAINNILEQRKKMFQRFSGDKRIFNLSTTDIIVTSKDEIFLKNVLQIIDKNMNDPEFDIEKVSHLLNMGRANFYKKFKSLTQIAPVEFVRDMRLQRAKQYFDAGGGNVAEIAYTVGFSSPKYFSTCFRAKYQISPSDYLRANKPSLSDENHHLNSFKS